MRSSGAFDVTGPAGFLVVLLYCIEIVVWMHCMLRVFGVATLPLIRIGWVVPLMFVTALCALASPTSWLWSNDPASLLTLWLVVIGATSGLLATQWSQAIAREFHSRHAPQIRGFVHSMLTKERSHAAQDEIWAAEWNAEIEPARHVVEELQRWNPAALGPVRQNREIDK
jgi:hypothetical protein